MHEIALGVTNVSPHFGPCHNPWALERMTGGSSGGSAAALAARLCLGSFGSDTGGSIRIPASLVRHCGFQADLWADQPARGDAAELEPRSPRPDGALRAGCRPAFCRPFAGYDPSDPASQPVAVDDYLSHVADGGARLADCAGGRRLFSGCAAAGGAGRWPRPPGYSKNWGRR